jgi:hypothetical protein
MIADCMNTQAHIPAELVGTWRLLSWTYQDEEGAQQDFFGDAPTGILMYDENGYMNAQLMKQGRSAFQSNALDGSTPQESKMAFDSYLSYFGRYWYDPERQAVVHKVEASLIPNWVGQEQVRYVRLEGRKLCIYTPPFLADGRMRVFNLEWEKL